MASESKNCDEKVDDTSVHNPTNKRSVLIPDSNTQTISLTTLRNKYAEVINKWYLHPDEPERVHRLILNGKALSDAIKTARSKGEIFLKVYDLPLNINIDTNLIMPCDLTRVRLMALLHDKVYRTVITDVNRTTNYPLSPLISRVTEESLTNIFGDKRFLIGGGYQFQSVNFEENEYFLYYCGAILLDYLSACHPNNKKYYEAHRNEGIVGFFNNGERVGKTLEACARNIDDLNFSHMKGEETIRNMTERLAELKIDWIYTSEAKRKWAQEMEKNRPFYDELYHFVLTVMNSPDSD